MLANRLLTLSEARSIGYRELYFTWGGLGDVLAMVFAAEEYYKRTGQKLLISTEIPELFTYQNCDLLSDCAVSLLYNHKTRHKYLDDLNNYDIKPFFILAYNDLKKLFEYPGKTKLVCPNNHLFARFCESLGLSGDLALNPKFTLTEDEKQLGRFFDYNQIAVMSNAIMKYKEWPISRTQELVNRLKDNYNFVQIGVSDDVKLENAKDLRGQYSLREVAAVLYNSDLFVGGIGGLMHLARAVDCRAVIAYSSAESKSLASYPCNINVSPVEGTCDLCSKNFRHPYSEPCYNDHQCVNNITLESMVNAVEEAINKKGILEIEYVKIVADKPNGLEYFYNGMSRLFCRSAYNRLNKWEQQ